MAKRNPEVAAKLAVAFEQITTWMRANGAGAIVDDFEPGASEVQLDEIEARFGFSLPDDLVELWRMYDGQRGDSGPFMSMCWLYSRESAFVAHGELEPLLEFSRENPETFAEDLTPAELESDAWVPFAGMDSDGIAVHAVSGRVVEYMHDAGFEVRAESLTAWVSEYAARLLADDYRVETEDDELFIEKRDRAAEARDAANRAELERKANLPAKALFDEALGHQRPHDAQDALYRARSESDAAFVALVDHLFKQATRWFGKLDPTLVANIVRPFASDLSLTAPQWNIVIEGAKRLGNNALREVALRKLRAN